MSACKASRIVLHPVLMNDACAKFGTHTVHNSACKNVIAFVQMQSEFAWLLSASARRVTKRLHLRRNQ